MRLYYNEDEWIEEASWEQSLMSTSRRDFLNNTSEWYVKEMTNFIENEVPLDLSRISGMPSFDNNVANEEYNDDKINSIKKEIFDIEKTKEWPSSTEKDRVLNQFIFDSYDKQNSGTLSSFKKLSRSDDTEIKSDNKLKNIEYDESDQEEDAEFYQNEFDHSHKNLQKENSKDNEIKDPMLVLFGDSKHIQSKPNTQKITRYNENSIFSRENIKT